MPDFNQIQENFASQYQLGDAEMDAVHEEFIAFCLEAQAVKGEDFKAAFQRLFEHTSQHFADEETRMQASGYPALGEHRADHQRILGDMDRFNQRLQAGRPAMMARAWLSDSLAQWFAVHAQTMDSALAAHLASVAQSVAVD